MTTTRHLVAILLAFKNVLEQTFMTGPGHWCYHSINNSRPSWLQGIPTSPSIEPLTLVDPEFPQSPAPASPVIDLTSHDADLEAKHLMEDILAIDLPDPDPPTRQEHERAFKAIGEAIAQEYTRARGAAVQQSVARKQVLCLKSITVDASLKRTADAQSGTYVPNTSYLGIGKDDLLPNGDLTNKYLARVLIKAFKAHAKEHPDQRASAVAEIKLLRNPKTMADFCPRLNGNAGLTPSTRK